ncbi:MAG: hypothetical protein JWP85_2332 [Rhodoglobus sp.]|nr:hypothetical protein [Rhodoglobus sp.]
MGQTEFDTVIAGGTVASLETGILEADIAISGGRIAAILEPGAEVAAKERIRADGLHVLPGVIDAHVHLGHGGPHAEEFTSETRSAAVGGVTTVLSYFRKEPYDYLRLLPELIAAGEKAALIDFGVHLVLFTDEHLEELPEYARLGVTSFKFFLGHQDKSLRTITALPHTGPHLPIDDAFILKGFEAVAALPGGVAVAHCENAEINALAAERAKEAGLDGLPAWNASRPDYSETEGVRRAVYWAELTGVPLYLVHMGSARSAREIQRIRRETTANILAETLVQYLTINENVAVGVLAKMNPPLRDEANRLGIWDAMKDGVYATVASDHGAFMRADKQEIWTSRTGTPSSGLILAGLLTEGYHAGRMSLLDIVRVTSAGPAKAFGLHPLKGSLTVGADADLVLVDLDKKQPITAEVMQSRSDYSPFEGLTMHGWPVRTISRGRTVVRDGEVLAQPGDGNYLSRPTASHRA